jgi:hypothetical protein
MREGAFQRLFNRSDPEVKSLNVQAAMGPARQPERSQFSQLLRHFLERFFAHETASHDGDAKARLVQIACAAGLPPVVVAIYLGPTYHPFRGWPPGNTRVGPPPYWLQVNHHFFFVLYSFVAMGLATVFEWDMFFPDLLDIFVLGTLPVAERRIFLARVGAIALLLFGFLFDANFLAPIVLLPATDPPNAPAMLAGHVTAAAASGIFAAAFILALQGILLAVLGDRLFQRISLAVQGIAVTVFVVLLLLFPVLSGVTPALLRSGRDSVLCFPPFWFLGMYQQLLEGPTALPIYATLAKIGCAATLATAALAIAAYPLAYARRVRQLLEGLGTRSTHSWITAPLHRLLHATAIRRPQMRAVFHFINQTLLRVPRYRIYLVLYGGVGLSILIATILRFTTEPQQVRAEVSADGLRTAIGIVAFWVITGLRTAFVSSGNQRGSWIWHVVHGRPPHFEAAMEQLLATKVWVALCGMVVTSVVMGGLRLVAPAELLDLPATAAQLLLVAGMCLLLTDVFFLNVMTVPFTGETAQQQENLAFPVLRYFTFFPLVTSLSLVSEHWIETNWLYLGMAAVVIIVAHLWLRKRFKDAVRLHSHQLALEEGEEDFPMKLGLRY